MTMGFGNGTRSPSTAATESVAPNPGVASGLYTFTSGQAVAQVFNHPSSTENLYVKWNADAAGKTAGLWDDVIEPGAKAVFPSRTGDAIVGQVAVWVDAAMTYGTDFSIQGWE